MNTTRLRPLNTQARRDLQLIASRQQGAAQYLIHRGVADRLLAGGLILQSGKFWIATDAGQREAWIL